MTDTVGDPAGLSGLPQGLRADCQRCQGLCCVAPAFAKSVDFAITKPAGRACPNLNPGFSCRIHDGLRDHGFRGCTVFDCFGAGQHVVQVTFAGSDWRRTPETATSMFTVFGVMRQLKELLWYLAEAAALLPSGPLRERVERLQEQTVALVDGSAEILLRLDAAGYRAQAGPVLVEVSETLRADVSGRGPDRVGADLMGVKLRGADLRGVSLRGAYLLGADLRGADLHRTDVLGADLRGCDLSAANLVDTLFLTQPQLDAATGDTATNLPPWLTRPRHWSASVASRPRRPRKRDAPRSR